jgi:hypothetical protein
MEEKRNSQVVVARTAGLTGTNLDRCIVLPLNFFTGIVSNTEPGVFRFHE